MSVEIVRAFPGKKAWGGRNANELKFCGLGVSEELKFCRLWVSEEIEFCGWGAEMQVKLKCWGCNFDRFPSISLSFYKKKKLTTIAAMWKTKCFTEIFKRRLSVQNGTKRKAWKFILRIELKLNRLCLENHWELCNNCRFFPKKYIRTPPT